MLDRGPVRTTRRTPVRWGRVVGLLAAIVAIAVVLGLRSPTSPTSQAASFVQALRAEGTRASRDRGTLGVADGAIPHGTSVFADEVPGVARLDRALLTALRRAATDAGTGVRFVVDSGWRSPEYQEHLLEQAVATYGTEAEAARWVATPERSEHVSGNAVDLGPDEARTWLTVHGAAYGLCRIYGNEPWHYELRPEAAERGCPPMYADPTHDPRLRP
jgi:D-alanyl-D-alanine carboxypeptidase